MRPVKLTMSAFGPYAKVTEIDFDALGRSGVYLVCGDTGAGKTMIFDALCFALFGEASGDVKGGARSTASLRSDYAEGSSKTYVELLFEYRGKRYRVKRNPDYTRAKARGEGETKQVAGAEIEFPDGRVVSGVRKVNAEVEELLGIDSGQFKQIVMLAQGEFRKLLTADTDSREEIFRKLFGTEVYEQVQDRLADESRKLERENQKVKTQVAAYASQAVFPAESDMAQELEQKRAIEGLYGAWLCESLQTQLGADRPVYQKLEDEVERLRREWYEANGLLKQVEDRPALERDKEAHERKVAQLKEEAPALAKAFEEQVALDGERAAAVEQAARIEGTFPKYEEHQAAVAAEKEAHEAAGKAQHLLGARLEAHEQCVEQVGALEREQAQLEGADVRLAQVKASLDGAVGEAEAALKKLADAQELDRKEAQAAEAAKALAAADEARIRAAEKQEQAKGRLEDAQQVLTALGNAAVELEQAKAAHDAAAGVVADLKARVNQHVKRVRACGAAEQPYQDALVAFKQGEAVHDADVANLQTLQKRQRAGRAGLLAADLREGEPCPVCGSTHHPHPAGEGGAVPSDDEIDAAITAEDRSRQMVTDLSIAAERLKAVLGEKRAELVAFENEHGTQAELEARMHDAEAALHSALARMHDAEAKVASAERARAAFEAATERYDEAVAASKRADEACQHAREGAIAAEHGAKALRESLAVTDSKAARAAYDAASQRVAEVRKAFEKAQDDAKSLGQKREELVAANKAAAEAQELLEAAREKVRSAGEAERLSHEKAAHLKADLEFVSLSEARERAGALRANAEKLKAARDAAERAVQENASSLKTNEELLKSDIRRLEQIPVVDVDATKAAMEGYVRQAAVLKDEASQLKTRIDANDTCLRGLEGALAKAGSIEERYGRVKLLADAATGNLVGKPKVRFEAYVQAIYFDKVIDAANQRLSVLTSGQFELIRYSDGSGNAKAGLGLYVVDSFTGRARDASSLSGGESFQASLCLALGLSDIVQAHAGGIEFDTMFVDEGFGSLDQGALGNAVSLLSDLSGGTKLVGIISHVEDLKANIPKKIVVTKHRTGSSVALDL